MKIKPEKRWVWIKMPEKHYYARVSIQENGTSRISMVDPIPNRPQDECYGESSKSKSIDDAVKKFVQGMMDDRKRYFGDKYWRPSKKTLRSLWRKRGNNFKEIRMVDELRANFGWTG